MSQLVTPATESYFTGSDRVLDYFIDFDVDAERQPLDVQAYLECIAIELRRQASPDDPEYDWTKIHDRKHMKPYEPRLELVSQGLDTLRQAAKTKEQGLWMDVSDVTDEDLSAENLANIPWLASLVRTDRLEQAAATAESFLEEPFSITNVVYGNVRIPFPNGLEGPGNGGWLGGTRGLYGRYHPMILAATYPSKDIIPKMRNNLWRSGVRHRPEPVLPLDPKEQEFFDENPELWFQSACRDWDTGAPLTPDPVGFREWQQERNRRIERQRKEEKERPRTENQKAWDRFLGFDK